MRARNCFFTSIACLTCTFFLTGFAFAAPYQAENDLETAIEEIGESVENALEKLARTFDESGEELGGDFEAWAEEHAEELEEWSDKYAGKWESWANGLERRMNGVAREHEQELEQWARKYEKSWERWGDELAAADGDAKRVGQLVEQNLKMLSEIPLGSIVDQAMREGLSELSEAPWESLDELGTIAQRAMDKPLQQMEELKQRTDQPESAAQEVDSKRVQERRQQSADVGADKKRDQLDARIRALEKLLDRQDLRAEQQEKLKHALAELRDARTMLNRDSQSDKKGRDRAQVPRSEVTNGAQQLEQLERELKARIQAERQRFAAQMEELEIKLEKIKVERFQLKKEQELRAQQEQELRAQQEFKRQALEQQRKLEALKKQELEKRERNQRALKEHELKQRELKKQKTEQKSDLENEVQRLRREVERLKKELETKEI